MSACKTLIRSSTLLHALEWRLGNKPKLSFSSLHLPTSQSHGLRFKPYRVYSRCYTATEGALLVDSADLDNEETFDNSSKDNVAHILTNPDDVALLMKMERRPLVDDQAGPTQSKRWFPYLDQFKCGNFYLNSGEVLEAVSPCIMDVRKERFKNAVKNRSYSVCLVVEGLSDFGNVSAAFRSADALGFQSVHVVSCDSSKRYRENRHVSMGAEKWLDIELWDSIEECFTVLKSRGYLIVTTQLGMDTVSVYDMDWSCPTAIVVGNENRGISDEALKLSDLHCSIPMKGMVDSFNVSVAAGLLMHQAVRDRTERLGCHGDLTAEERQILLAEFSLRHSKTTIAIAHEYAKMKVSALRSKL